MICPSGPKCPLLKVHFWDTLYKHICKMKMLKSWRYPTTNKIFAFKGLLFYNLTRDLYPMWTLSSFLGQKQ